MNSMERFEFMQKKASTNINKGKRNGDCNVTQCQKSGACSYNTPMRAYYCSDCATNINRTSQKFNKVDFCDVLEDGSLDRFEEF